MSTYFPDDVLARRDYAQRTAGSLLKNLFCNTGLHLHIADDSEQRIGLCDQLIHNAAEYWESSSYSNSQHSGIGGSLNMALETVHFDEQFMYTTDDWVLQSPLILDGPLKLLTAYGYDLVRLGPIHPDLQCVTRFDASIGWWLDLLPHYGGFAFATRPFIATKAFYDKIGPFDERMNSYETERLYAERVAKSSCKLAYWGGVTLDGPWEHCGIENVGYANFD